MELPATVQEVWFVLAQRTIVVGVAVVKLVSAPGQPVHSHRPRQVVYSKKGMPISLSPQL